MTPMRLFLALHMRRIHHHETRQFRGRGGRDDLALEAAFGQQRQAPAMIEMRMRQKHEIDGAGVKAEGAGVFLSQFAAALQQAAIDENFLVRRFEQMAGAGDIAVRAVKGESHPRLPSPVSSGSPFFSYQCRMPLQISPAVSANQNRSRSSGSITPCSRKKSGLKARRQYCSPTSTIGTGANLRVCDSARISNSSSMVP